MARTLEVEIRFRLDGRPLEAIAPGGIIIGRLSVDEVQVAAPHEKTNDGNATSFAALPTSELDEIQVLFVKSDKATTYRLDGATDTGIPLNAGGFYLIFNADIDAGAGASNAKVNNNSGATATIDVLAGGT